VLLCFVVGCISVVSAQTADVFSPLSEAPLRPEGQHVIPLFDGWFPNEDGTSTMCFGYYNMNSEEQIDVPLGQQNFIEPEVYDGVQPTHFDTRPTPELTPEFRRYWCAFSVTVPEDFGMADVIWNIETQGRMLSVPGTLIPSYILDEEEWQAKVGEPINLITRISHAEPGTWINWTLHQGTNAVEFSAAESRIGSAEGIIETTATFEQAGEYMLRVQAINDTERPRDPTYGFEFHCCWTNAYVRVEVNE